MSEVQTVGISLAQVGEYEFNVRFDDTALAPLTTDESPPLGHGAGPNPSRLLAAAVANCLAASLLFALRKFHDAPSPLTARATASIERNAQGRWRVSHLAVDLALGDAAAVLAHLDVRWRSSRTSAWSPAACAKGSRWTCACWMRMARRCIHRPWAEQGRAAVAHSPAVFALPPSCSSVALPFS